jgi:hypothetical protein
MPATNSGGLCRYAALMLDTEFMVIVSIGPALILMFVAAFFFFRVLTALVWGIRR